MPRLGWACALAAAFHAPMPGATAAPPAIPYETRTQAYNGLSSTVHGDIRTVGMAGAAIGLADTFIASLDNPAGLAMTLKNADANITTNWARDQWLQNSDAPVQTTNFGVALSTYPWGWSLGYVSPYHEQQVYSLGNLSEEPVSLGIEVRELRFSLARLFLDEKLSVGTSFNIGQAEMEFASTTTDFSKAYHSYSVGLTLGALWQLPGRVLLGASYSPAMTYGGSVGAADQVPGIRDFFQEVNVPGRLGLGVGWIPNRFFRTDFSFYFFGTSPRTALLRDQGIAVGPSVTVQPRLGAAYTFAEFRYFSGTAFAGAYYETLRHPDSADRLHLTGGIETKPWIFTFGWGVDLSPGYKNYLVTAGLDVFKLMEQLDLIPRPWHPPYAGAFPKMSQNSEEGLARPLVRNWRPGGPEIDPIQVGLELPGKLQKKVIEAGERLQDFAEDVAENFRDAVPGGAKRKPRAPKPGPSPSPTRPAPKSPTKVPASGATTAPAPAARPRPGVTATPSPTKKPLLRRIPRPSPTRTTIPMH